MKAKRLEFAGYDRKAPRKAVNRSPNADLISRAKDMTTNLSGTVEELLADFVETENARRRASDTALDQVISALNAFVNSVGF